MSSLTAWLWGTSQLDDAVDKATSELLPAGSEDIALNLEICDQIRSKSAPTKDAMRALKRRINHKNPNVQLLALGLTDICIKNGGDHFLAEVASREFIDNLISLLKTPALNIEVKNTMLRLIQNWANAFEGKPSLNYVGHVYKDLKAEGYKFPPRDLAVANAAMVDTQTAPEWIDSDVCLRCRTPFTFTNRKHHCRNCGQVFDQTCSSKSMPLPHFGITQEVRVCDGCYSKLSRKVERSHGLDNKRHSHPPGLQNGPRHRSARELDDQELQRAIQMSLQELNAMNGNSRPGYVPYQPAPSEPPLFDRKTYSQPKSSSAEEDDPDLRAAIEASLREANAPRPSAPVEVETPRSEAVSSLPRDGRQYSQSYPPSVVPPPHPVQTLSNYDLEPLESDAILTFSQTVEEVQARGGRDMSRYPGVTELYDKANGLRPKLAMNLDDTGRKEQLLSEMHDKLSQAVKLYDQLLTQQVSQPRWRSSLPAVSSNMPYQQTIPHYNPAQSLRNDHQQWAPSQTPISIPSETPKFDRAQSQPQTQAHTGIPTVQDYGRQHVDSLGQAYLSDSGSQQRQPVHQPQLAQFAPNAFNQTPVPQLGESRPVTTYQSPQPSEGHLPAQYPSQVTQPPAPTTTVYTQNASSASPQVSAPVYQSSAPVYLPQSPPPPQQSYVSQPIGSQSHTSPTISPVRQPARYNTISVASRNAHHSRHNTIAHAPTHRPPHQQPPAAVTAFPQFPVVPTSAPQSYPLYGPAAPSGVPQTETKEALLIDL